MNEQSGKNITIESANRCIKGQIPPENTIDLIDRLELCESRSMHGQLPIEWSHAEGHNVYDSNGNCWIDFTSTIFVTNIGHSNPTFKSYLKSAIDNSSIACYAYANSIRARYIEELLCFAGSDFQKAFLLSAGTEATEAALKLMRMYGKKEKKNRLGIVCISGNWHGRTMGAQLMSDNKKQREWIGFDDHNIHHINFPYPWTTDESYAMNLLESEINRLRRNNVNPREDLCGVMLETFQGWGALFYPKDYVQGISKFCKENNILLCFDEMQAGFGRTGKNFGFEHYDVVPDLFACGKGMGGGLPLSGVVGRSEIMDLPDVGNMSSTHSANPLCCAAGLAVIHELKKNNLVERSKVLGRLLKDKLMQIKKRHCEYINYISCKGLIVAIIFKCDSKDFD